MHEYCSDRKANTMAFWKLDTSLAFIGQVQASWLARRFWRSGKASSATISKNIWKCQWIVVPLAPCPPSTMNILSELYLNHQSEELYDSRASRLCLTTPKNSRSTQLTAGTPHIMYVARLCSISVDDKCVLETINSQMLYHRWDLLVMLA